MTLASKTTENQSSFDDKHINERTGKNTPLDFCPANDLRQLVTSHQLLFMPSKSMANHLQCLS
jgi:hypothetical protein